MKTIIAGSRNLFDYSLVEKAVKESGFTITEVVSGGQLGIDCLGDEWAKRNKIDLVIFEANWEGRGKSAGPHRNGKMADYAQALIAIPSVPMGKGTADIIKQAKKRGLKIFIYQGSK